MRRAGFTLVEVLVSILIFSVVSVAMLTVFTLATRVFRDTEAARIAGDESIAALSTLDDDLSRMAPTAAGGFLYCGVHNDDGNIALAFAIDAADIQVGYQGSATAAYAAGSRLTVLWWADERGRLHRNVGDPPGNGVSLDTRLANLFDDIHAPVIATGCLYFGADLHTAATPRTDLAWTPPLDPPAAPGSFVCTMPFSPSATTVSPSPTAMRIALVLTGGDPSSSGTGMATAKEAAVGFLTRDVSATDTDIPTYGLRALPSYPGALVRIGDLPDKVEWLAYDRFANGRIHVTARAQRRTDANPHARGAPVRVGRTYTLVRELPR